jgi:hypothetical protein
MVSWRLRVEGETATNSAIVKGRPRHGGFCEKCECIHLFWSAVCAVGKQTLAAAAAA